MDVGAARQVRGSGRAVQWSPAAATWISCACGHQRRRLHFAALLTHSLSPVKWLRLLLRAQGGQSRAPRRACCAARLLRAGACSETIQLSWRRPTRTTARTMLSAWLAKVVGGDGAADAVAAAARRLTTVLPFTTAVAPTTTASTAAVSTAAVSTAAAGTTATAATAAFGTTAAAAVASTAASTAAAATTAALSTVPFTTGAAPAWDRISTLMVLTQVSAALSVIGAACIIVTFFAFRQLRQRRGRQLIFFLSICDLLTALTYSFEPNSSRRPYANSEVLCQVQGIATIFFPVASFLWTLCISIFIFLSTPQPMKSFRVTHAVFHAVCWAVPTVLCVVVVAYNRAGSSAAPAGTTDIHNTGGWCWLNTTNLDAESRLMWELIGGKGVEISCIVAVCVLYFFTARKFRANDMHELQQTLLPDVPVRLNVREFQRKLVLVPLFFVLARLWGSINTFLFAFGGGGDDNHGGAQLSPGMATFIVVMECLQAFCDPIQGFLNGILFVAFSVEVRMQIVEHWGRPCRRRQRGHIASTTPSFSSPNGPPDRFDEPRLSDTSLDSQGSGGGGDVGGGEHSRSRYDSDY